MMSNATFGMLLLSIVTGWLVMYDLAEEGPGVGLAMLVIESVVAVLWIVALVLKGMGVLS